MSDAIQLVRDFVEAVNANDLDRVMGFFDPECVYHNIPIAPVKGLEAIRVTLQGFMGMASEIDWVLDGIAEGEPGSIFTERLDRFRIQGKWLELPIMGIFEIRDGKILAWRDYFDMEQFRSQLPTG